MTGENTYNFKPRGNVHGFHKSLFYACFDLTCHSCEHNGECLIGYRCTTLNVILLTLFPDVKDEIVKTSEKA